jgi:hypothetical protein
MSRALAYFLRPSVAQRVVVGCVLLLALPLEWQMAVHVFHLPWYLAWTVPVIVELYLAVALEHRTRDRGLAIGLFLGSLMLSGTVHLATTGGAALPWWLPGVGQLVFLTVGTIAAVRVVLLAQRTKDTEAVAAAAPAAPVAPPIPAPAPERVAPPAPARVEAPRPVVPEPRPVEQDTRSPRMVVPVGDRKAARTWARQYHRLNGSLPEPRDAAAATGLDRTWWKDTLRARELDDLRTPGTPLRVAS